ncbi:MAG: 50S ribosomal protein L11 methyltransferase [Candidatus Levyibacteriota bacterium]
MTFILFNLFLVAIILFLFLLLSMVWPPDSPWSPWWTTSEAIAEKMCKLAKVTEKDIIYDLGCGTGTALIVAAKEYGATGVGIEIDPIRFLCAKFNVKESHTSKKITLIKDNFNTISLIPATVLFIYLVPNALKRLAPKFLKEIRPGTRFISYKYAMPIELFKQKLQLIKHDTKDEIFIYKMLS